MEACLVASCGERCQKKWATFPRTHRTDLWARHSTVPPPARCLDGPDSRGIGIACIYGFVPVAIIYFNSPINFHSTTEIDLHSNRIRRKTAAAKKCASAGLLTMNGEWPAEELNM